MDDILGIPEDKRYPVDLLEFLKVQLVMVGLAFGTTLFCALLWSIDLPYPKAFKFLFPRILAIWMVIFILVSLGGAYYVATVKYGLQVW